MDFGYTNIDQHELTLSLQTILQKDRSTNCAFIPTTRMAGGMGPRSASNQLLMTRNADLEMQKMPRAPKQNARTVRFGRSK
jgi:hypothetical protein